MHWHEKGSLEDYLNFIDLFFVEINSLEGGYCKGCAFPLEVSRYIHFVVHNKGLMEERIFFEEFWSDPSAIRSIICSGLPCS